MRFLFLLSVLGLFWFAETSHADKPTPPRSYKQVSANAVSFFANGKLLRKCLIEELVDDPTRLEISVSHFEWRKQSRIIDDKSQFEVVTYDGNRVLYDLVTAKIVAKKKAK